MSTRSWLTAIALVALFACAHAIPAANKSFRSKSLNDIPDILSNEISKKDVVTKEVTEGVIEKYPHAVLFARTCGGTIISPNWILTAAHCTLFMSGRYVLAGTSNSIDGSGVQKRVKKLVIHPLFTVGPYWLKAEEYNIKQVSANWDFLLVELGEPLPLDGVTMKAATLETVEDLPVGLDVGYAGYGTDHHGGYMRHEMHGMELAIEANSVCEKALEQFDSKDMVCTKGRPPNYDSACNGDSGSGLVDNNGTLIGVLSWVQDDALVCEKGKLTVFSRVSAVREWIRHVTNI